MNLRHAPLLLTCTLCLAPLAATAQPVVSHGPASALEQTAERITLHDAGSHIEELRVGGQTRYITVQTNSALPGYQVAPLRAPSSSDDSTSSASGGMAGRSSWRLMAF